MSSTTIIEKDHTRIAKYNGKPEEYQRWQITFMAVLRQRNMPELVGHIHDADQTPKDDDECEDENGVMDPLRLNIKEQNKRAFVFLITTMERNTDEAKLAFNTISAMQQWQMGMLMGISSSLGRT